MTPEQCYACDRVSADGAPVCTHCTATLAEQLRGVVGLVDDLLTALSKTDKVAPRSGGKGRSTGWVIPFRLDVPDVVWTLGNTLTTWARDIADTAGIKVDARALERPVYAQVAVVHPRQNGKTATCPVSELPVVWCAHCLGHHLPDDVPIDEHLTTLGRSHTLEVAGHRGPAALDALRFAATWLAEHAGLIRSHPAALEAHDELTHAIEHATAVTDRPSVQVFCGRCEKCDANLHAGTDDIVAVCSRCGTPHTDLLARRDRALRILRGYPATAAVIAGDIGELYGVIVNRKTINQWHARGKLRKVDDDPETGDPRFRIGDVLDRARRDANRRSRRVAQ